MTHLQRAEEDFLEVYRIAGLLGLVRQQVVGEVEVEVERERPSLGDALGLLKPYWSNRESISSKITVR
jgi:hypothetical protein